MHRYQGHVGAALVLGGVDSTGPHLFTIHPHGSTDKLPYVTMGSGSLAAMAVFESGWKPNMEVRPMVALPGQRLILSSAAKLWPWYQRPSRLVSLTILAQGQMSTRVLSPPRKRRCSATLSNPMSGLRRSAVTHLEEAQQLGRRKT